MADAAAEDEFDPKDPVEEVRGAEALGRGMGLNESAVKYAVDAVDARRADGLVCTHAGREHIRDGWKRPWDGAASGRGMEDVRHEMAVQVILRELAYKSWTSEAGR